jgi:tetratricopeptide (TPR) repeat protein
MARPKQKKGAGGGFGRRVRGLPGEGERPPARRWRLTVAVIAIVLLAFFVRFYGLSHDLSQGNIYHPDTPKQRDAAEKFLRGHYYFAAKPPSRDIDGYPYFNMHLVEYEWRGLSGVQSTLQFLMGWDRQFTLPGEYGNLDMRLFVLARVSVCLLSTLAVFIMYRIGRELCGELVGLVAAALAAVSWLNVETAHYAMPDAVMELFLCLTVLVGLRMYRTERLIYPALTGFLGALTFAAKYNGGGVLVFVALLHVLKYFPRRGALWRLLSGKAIQAAVLVVAGAVVGLVAAIPSLLIYPDRVVKHIAEFMQHASQFRELPPTVASGEESLFAYAARDNFSVVWRAAGPVLIVAAIVGLVASAFRNRRHILPGLLLVFYLGMLLVSARTVKPYYFGPALLLMCLYVAVVPDWLLGLSKRFGGPRTAGGAAIAAPGFALVSAAFIIGTVHVGQSGFFFWHMSSRRVATAWVEENIPREFTVREPRYTLYGTDRYVEQAVEALAMATSTIDQIRMADDAVALKVFEVEATESLTWFRNPGVTLWLLPGSSHLRGDFGMPVYERLASPTGNEYVFVDGAEFVRTGRMIDLEPRATRRLFVIPEAPDEVLVELRNGQTGNRVTVSFGGQVQEVSLNPLERRVIVFKEPARMRLTGRPIYKLWARAPFPCRAEVAVTDEQKGVLYYNAGRYDRALPHLVAAWCPALDEALVKQVVDAHNTRQYVQAQEALARLWARRPSLAVAQMAVVAALCSGQDVEKLVGGPELAAAVRADLERTGTSLFERFGVSSTYLDLLPYVELEAESLVKHGHHDAAASGDACVMPRTSPGGRWALVLNDLFLEPGAYRVTLRARLDEGADPASRVSVSFVDSGGQIVYDTADLDMRGHVGPVYGDVACTLRFADLAGPATLKVTADDALPLRIDTIKVAPDYDTTVAARDALVRALVDRDMGRLEPVAEHVEPLLAYGVVAEGKGDVELALAAYEKAAEADPGSYKPYEAMRRIVGRLPEAEQAAVNARLDEVKVLHELPETRAVAVRFKNGAELTRWRPSAEEYRPGDTVELTLFWSVPAGDAARFGGRDLFIHFLPQGAPKDHSAFQGDTTLVQDFGFDERLDRVQPVYRHRIRIPQDAVPGVYEIEVGIEINVHAKRIRIVEADVPHTNNSATIGTIRIVERAPVPSS